MSEHLSIIDAAGRMPAMIESLRLLADADGWTQTDKAGIADWMNRYLDWLLVSENGNDEARQHNNHGTWFDAQLIAMAAFVGRPQIARRVAAQFPALRIATQIEPDGTQPYELARRTSMNYTAMNLAGMLSVVLVARRFDVDILRTDGPDGRLLRKALAWFAPFVRGEKPWQHEQIKPPHDEANPLLMHAAHALTGDDQFAPPIGEHASPLLGMLW